MIELELHALHENPSWLAVLLAYQNALEQLAASDAASKSDGSRNASSAEIEPADFESDDDSASPAESALDSDTDADGASEPAADDEAGTRSPRRRASRWVPRLKSVSNLESEELSRIHGRLIAYGFLKCDLTDRAAGVVYQLTPEAKQALTQISESIGAESEAFEAEVA